MAKRRPDGTATAGIENTQSRRPLSPGKFTLEQRGLNTGHGSNPFFLLSKAGAATEETGTVWFGTLAYSGNGSLRFETMNTRYVRVHGGYETGDFELRLAPGESHKTPAMPIGVSGQGRGGASRRLHRFAGDYVLPAQGVATWRPVLYNSWEATEFNVSYANQSRLAAIAADLGVGLFVVDDGQHQGEYVGPVRLRGLNPNATYAVLDETGAGLGRFTGTQLMALGLPGDAGFGGNKAAIRSRTVLLRDVGRD